MDVHLRTRNVKMQFQTSSLLRGPPHDQKGGEKDPLKSFLGAQVESHSLTVCGCVAWGRRLGARGNR